MNARGQSMVEYMLIATALITLILSGLIKSRINWSMLGIMDRARVQIANPSSTADLIIPSPGH